MNPTASVLSSVSVLARRRLGNLPNSAPVPGTEAVALVDATFTEIVDVLTNQIVHGVDRPMLAFALHIGGLNHIEDPAYAAALEQGDLLYADGMSAVLLARTLGAQRIDRCATTDLAPAILRESLKARPIRIALIGGPTGLARDAGAELMKLAEPDGHQLEVVYTRDGFCTDDEWLASIAALNAARPDVVLVGLGVPTETLWCARYESILPAAVVITCGGLFGHIVGHERRAPLVLQRIGLEWTWRLAQRPELLQRYSTGMVTFLKILRRARRMNGLPA